MRTLEPAALILNGPPLFDGCRLRYLDLGTNVGVRISSLYSNLDKEPPRKAGLFAGENRSEICSVGFEPNPGHGPLLASIQHDLRRRGHRVTILGAAIAANNGTATFWSDKVAAMKEWGASLLHWSPDMDSSHSFQVPTVELDWFLRHHLGAASLGPASPRAPLTLVKVTYPHRATSKSLRVLPVRSRKDRPAGPSLPILDALPHPAFVVDVQGRASLGR